MAQIDTPRCGVGGLHTYRHSHGHGHKLVKTWGGGGGRGKGGKWELSATLSTMKIHIK